MADSQIELEQQRCVALRRRGLSHSEISRETGLSRHQVHRRLKAAAKKARLDPEIVGRLKQEGIEDLAGVHSGWFLNKNKTGSGSSIYFYLGPDEEPLNFTDAVIEALSDIPRVDLAPAPELPREAADTANWLFLADLHVGGDYGADYLENDFRRCVSDIYARLPAATHLVITELGDLLDANDHKGVTPASGNPCDVVRDDHLGNTKQAIRLLKFAIDQGLLTHDTVDVHVIPGNHDPTAYIAVLLALEEHYREEPRVVILVPSNGEEETYRVVSWGTSAFFPHHGHQAKWPQLKDVWADQFAEEWAAAKMFRMIATGHYHTTKSDELVGAHCRQFSTIHRPNKWAKDLGYLNRGTLTALTIHKELGYRGEIASQVKPVYLKGTKA